MKLQNLAIQLFSCLFLLSTVYSRAIEESENRLNKRLYGNISLCDDGRRHFFADYDGWYVKCPGSYTTVCSLKGQVMCLTKLSNGNWNVYNRSKSGRIEGYIYNYDICGGGNGSTCRMDSFYCKVYGPGQTGCY